MGVRRCTVTYMFFICLTFIYIVYLSLVHKHKFAPGTAGVYFWPCERCFKNLHPVANLHQGAICSCFQGGANLFAPGCKLCT